MERLRVIRDMVQFHQSTVQVRKDIDLDLLTLFLIHSRVAVRQYFALTYNPTKNPCSSDEIYGVSEVIVREILGKYAELLRGALSPKEESV